MIKALANLAVVFLSVAAFCFVWFSNSPIFEKLAASMAVFLSVLYVYIARGFDDDKRE